MQTNVSKESCLQFYHFLTFIIYKILAYKLKAVLNIQILSSQSQMESLESDSDELSLVHEATLEALICGYWFFLIGSQENRSYHPNKMMEGGFCVAEQLKQSDILFY